MPRVTLQPDWQQLVLGLAVVVVLLGLESLQLLQPAYAGTRLVLKPVQNTAAQVVWLLAQPVEFAQDSWRSFQTIQQLEYQVSFLSARVVQLEGELADLQAVEQMIPATRTVRFLTRPVLAYGQPQVAVGTRDGVDVGQAVIGQNTLLGRVGQTDSDASVVTLLSDTRSQPVIATTTDGATGVVVGDGRRVMLTEVARGAEVSSDQRVVTQGQVGIPADLLVGWVVTNITAPGAPVQSFLLEQGVSFNQLRIVEVVSP